MKMSHTYVLHSILGVGIVMTLAACGGEDGDDNPGTADAPTADAKPQVDARPSTVMEVDCASSTPTVTFLTGGSSFLDGSVQTNPPEMDAATVNRGQVAKFVSTSGHPIGPIPSNPNSDPALVVPETRTKCFSFPVSGTYEFRCIFHSFAAKLTVN